MHSRRFRCSRLYPGSMRQNSPTRHNQIADILQNYPGKIIIDLVRAWKDVDYAGVYEGLSWGNINANTAAQYQKIEKDIKGTEF